MGKRNKINILCASDNNYVFGYTTMLKSLTENNMHVSFEVYYLYCDLEIEKQDYLINNCENDNLRIHFLKINNELLEGLPEVNHLTKEAYIRLICHLVLPNNIDKILWLDGDIVINGDITDFYLQNIDDYMYAAVSDVFDETIKSKIKLSLDIPKEYDIINSGVLLINLKVVRKQIDLGKIQCFVVHYRDSISFCDQDVINGLYYDKIKVISDKRWNGHTGHIKNSKIKNYRIVHYTSKVKPWKENYIGSGFKLFWKYGKKLENGKMKYSLVKKSYIIQKIKAIPITCYLILKNFAYQNLPSCVWNFGKNIVKRHNS